MPENSLGYIDYEYFIRWNLKNVQLCRVFADPATNMCVFVCVTSFTQAHKYHRAGKHGKLLSNKFLNFKVYFLPNIFTPKLSVIW